MEADFVFFDVQT